MPCIIRGARRRRAWEALHCRTPWVDQNSLRDDLEDNTYTAGDQEAAKTIARYNDESALKCTHDARVQHRQQNITRNINIRPLRQGVCHIQRLAVFER